MYWFLISIIRFFMGLIFRIRVTGAENIPKDGGGIICANHISNWDALLLQTVSPRRIYYMAKEELFHVFFVGFVLKKIKAIPVKREGSDLMAVKLSLKTIKNGDILGIFPTGQRSKKKGEGQVKAGVGLIAGKTAAPIIPIHIVADYKLFSTVRVNIGEPRVYSAPEGEKLTVDMAGSYAEDIYKTIKEL